MRTVFALLIFLACSPFAQAQQAPADASPAAPTPRPTPPSGPLLKPAPDFSQWEIHFTYVEDQARKDKAAPSSKSTGAETRLQQINTTKTGKIIHEISIYLDGKQIDTWHNGMLQYTKRPSGNDWGMKTGNMTNGRYDDASYEPFPATGFRGLNWVNAGTYVTTIAYGDRSCLVFSKVGADKIDLSDPAKQKKLLDAQQAVAFIDSETRLPISVRANTTVCVYRFLAPPTGMQTFPDDLAAEIKKGENARIRLLQLAPRPY